MNLLWLKALQSLIMSLCHQAKSLQLTSKLPLKKTTTKKTKNLMSLKSAVLDPDLGLDQTPGEGGEGPAIAEVEAQVCESNEIIRHLLLKKYASLS